MPADISGQSRFKTFIRRIALVGLEALFPAICCSCGHLFKLKMTASQSSAPQAPDKLFKHAMRAFLCTSCIEALQTICSPMCVQCGQPFVSPHGLDHLCGQCRSHPFRFQTARAAGIYHGGLRSAIHHYKYKGRDNMAKPLGRLLWHTLRFYYDPLYFDRVVPVPLHPRRLRRRGFNQAYALIHEWPELALRYGLTQRSDWVDAGTLKRPRPTQPQTGLKRDRRAANLRSAFKVSHDRNIKNERILLVDDVLTTGATADACAQALLHAGAAEVCVLTLARAVL